MRGKDAPDLTAALAAGARDTLRTGRPLRVTAQAASNLAVLIAAVVSAMQAPPIALIFCWAIAGLVLAGCYTAAHECAHATFAQSARVNTVMGRIWATMALLNFTVYRRYHLQHHARTGQAGDTEEFGWRYGQVSTYARDLAFSGCEFLLQMSVWSNRILIGRGFPSFLTRPPERSAAWWDAVLLAGWQGALVLASVIDPWLALRIVWGPYAAYAVWIFITGLPEHYATTPGSNPLANTRSVRSNPLFRWLYWSGNLHAEHHLFPAIPAHSLMTVHRLIAADLHYCERSFVGFHLGVLKGILQRRALEQ